MTELAAPHKKRIRVLVVDDSIFMRMAIRNLLGHDPEIEVVGTAADGVEGVIRAEELRPDLITMDIEMPRMDGISAVRQIMAKTPTRILMVSSLTREGASATFDALDAGAIDFIAKHSEQDPGTRDHFQIEFLRKVKGAASAPIPTAGNRAKHISPGFPATAGSRHCNRSPGIVYVGIGASTGGPLAVQEVLTQLPADYAKAVIVVIHMPKAFTGPYAERLNGKCRLPVKEAANGDPLLPGRILIAPGGEHTVLVRKGKSIVVATSPPSDYPHNIYIPSVDLMLASLADVSPNPVLGVILTGMGNDGLKGMQHLKSKGGITLVQDQATSTVYGMPRSCIEGGVADEILPLPVIGLAISKIA